jgi:transposase
LARGREWIREVIVVEAVYQRCVGIDVGKAELKVCLRVQGRGSRPTRCTVTTWSTRTPQLIKLRDRLVADKVERVVMESTSDYWRPVFYVLSEQLDVILVKASDVKAMPGRKSDVSDAEWLADLAAHQLVRASFVPPEQQRQLRDLTRARARLLDDRTREVQRLEKNLEDACIKLSTVATDLQGVSARQMLHALIEGRDDPAAMAELAHGRMRAKIAELTEALTGRVTDHHRFMISFRLRRIDAATDDLAVLDARIDQLIQQAPGFSPARDLLLTVPGLGLRGAEDLLAEIGPDMTNFESTEHLASWVGVCPGSHESAGKKKNVATRPGNRYAKRALGMAAKNVIRHKSGFLSVRFKRLVARRGFPKALVATEHAMIIAIWHMLTTGSCYHDLGPDYYIRRTPQKVIRRKIADLEAAGYTVIKTAA